jgi:hypoxanthine phosphoribosyltransferase
MGPPIRPAALAEVRRVKILLHEEQVRAGVRRMSEEINAHYVFRPLTIVGVLTGSIVLLADLIRLLNMPLRVGVVQASSYRGAATTRGDLVVNTDLLPDVGGRDVLVVDDIFDTGHTLSALLNKMQSLGATSIRSAVLLRKRGRQEMSREPDHVAFEIPDEFVVGYGLDFNDAYRNLPFIAALEPHEIAAGKSGKST